MRDRLFAPIEYDAAKRGYFYSEKNELPLYTLSPENVSVLAAAKQLLSRCKSGKFGAFAAEKPKKYEIEFFDGACEYVSFIKWAEDQKIEKDEAAGKITISFTSSQSFKIDERVCSQGSCARPLEPPELVENWRQNAEGMWKMPRSIEPRMADKSR